MVLQTRKWLLVAFAACFSPLVNADGADCSVDGMTYPSGHVLDKFCFILVCNDSQWEFEGSIDPDCGHCWLHDDPHINTFDGHTYDWHGRCNYSLAQPDHSYNPNSAVFASFKTCFGDGFGTGMPSCVDMTTFKDNPHTVVEMNAEEPEKIWVNGEYVEITDPVAFTTITTSDGPQPLLALKIDECTVVVGNSGFVVMQCPYRTDVWASTSYSGMLHGLCGNYNMNDSDDISPRDGLTILPYDPTTFPLYWLANFPPSPACYQDYINNNDAQCRKPKKKYARICDKITRGNEYLNETCQYDLCLLMQVSGNNRYMRKWLRILATNAYMTEWIANATQALPM